MLIVEVPYWKVGMRSTMFRNGKIDRFVGLNRNRSVRNHLCAVGLERAPLDLCSGRRVLRGKHQRPRSEPRRSVRGTFRSTQIFPKRNRPTPEQTDAAGIAIAGFAPSTGADACAALPYAPSSVGEAALLQRQHLAEMTTRRLMELIEVAATRSGHPNVVFAVISLVVSGLTIVTLRSLIELLGAI
jgi:hypothetical protein